MAAFSRKFSTCDPPPNRSICRVVQSDGIAVLASPARKRTGVAWFEASTQLKSRHAEVRCGGRSCPLATCPKQTPRSLVSAASRPSVASRTASGRMGSDGPGSGRRARRRWMVSPRANIVTSSLTFPRDARGLGLMHAVQDGESVGRIERSRRKRGKRARRPARLAGQDRGSLRSDARRPSPSVHRPLPGPLRPAPCFHAAGGVGGDSLAVDLRPCLVGRRGVKRVLK